MYEDAEDELEEDDDSDTGGLDGLDVFGNPGGRQTLKTKS